MGQVGQSSRSPLPLPVKLDRAAFWNPRLLMPSEGQLEGGDILRYTAPN